MYKSQSEQDSYKPTMVTIDQFAKLTSFIYNTWYYIHAFSLSFRDLTPKNVSFGVPAENM